MDDRIQKGEAEIHEGIKSNLNSIKIFIGSKINVNKEISVLVILAILRIDRLNLNI